MPDAEVGCGLPVELVSMIQRSVKQLRQSVEHLWVRMTPSQRVAELSRYRDVLMRGVREALGPDLGFEERAGIGDAEAFLAGILEEEFGIKLERARESDEVH